MDALRRSLEAEKDAAALALAKAEAISACAVKARDEQWEQRLAADHQDRDAISASLSEALAERDALKASLSIAVTEGDALKASLSIAVTEGDALKASLSIAVTERDALKEELDDKERNWKGRTHQLEEHLEEVDSRLPPRPRPA